MPLAATTVFRVFMLLASFPGTRKHVARLVKGAREWWSGRKIAVIGPTAAGKDSFLARLQGRQIPEVHSNSQMGEKVKSFRVKLALSHHQTIDITCKGVINIGGETDYRDAPSGWLEVCKGADVIFYVMTVTDLAEKRYLKGRRVREDLDWLLTTLPHLKEGVLIHILINKIDEEIECHTDYPALAGKLAEELRALDKVVEKVLFPYASRYSGATLISMKNKRIYTLGLHDALRSVYSALHGDQKRRAA